MTAVIPRRLAAAAVGLVFSCAAATQTAAPGATPLSPMQPIQSIPPHGSGVMGRRPGPASGLGDPYGMSSHHGGAPFLRGLNLGEAQRDKIFAVEYAQMPEACEQRKTIEHARRGLHQIVTSGQYDEARAHSLTESLGRVVTREAQLCAQAGAKVMQVLTPEQCKQITDCEAQRVAELPPERSKDAPMPELTAM